MACSHPFQGSSPHNCVVLEQECGVVIVHHLQVVFAGHADSQHSEPASRQEYSSYMLRMHAALPRCPACSCGCDPREGHQRDLLLVMLGLQVFMCAHESCTFGYVLQQTFIFVHLGKALQVWPCTALHFTALHCTALHAWCCAIGWAVTAAVIVNTCLLASSIESCI